MREGRREGDKVEGGQDAQEGISPWFKRSCARRERALLGLWGRARWQSGGLHVYVFVCLCIRVSVCVCTCLCLSACAHGTAVCKRRSAIFNIPVSLDLEYQNNLSTESTDAPSSPHPSLHLSASTSPPPPLPPRVFPSLSSHIWSTVSTAIPLTKLIFVSSGDLSLNKTFVSERSFLSMYCCVAADEWHYGVILSKVTQIAYEPVRIAAQMLAIVTETIYTF